jgi:hypothetical protein
MPGSSRHQQPTGDDSLSVGDGDLIEAMTGHFERHVGTVDVVFHEIVSPYVHVDVHHIPPGVGPQPSRAVHHRHAERYGIGRPRGL